MPALLSVSPVRFRRSRVALAVAALLPTTLASLPALAAEGDDGKPLEEVVIFARGENLIGRAVAASEGAVGGADAEGRARPGRSMAPSAMAPPRRAAAATIQNLAIYFMSCRRRTNGL